MPKCPIHVRIFSHFLAKVSYWILILWIFNDTSRNSAYFLRPYTLELPKLLNYNYTKIAIKECKDLWCGPYECIYSFLEYKSILLYRNCSFFYLFLQSLISHFNMRHPVTMCPPKTSKILKLFLLIFSKLMTQKFR